MKKADYTDFVHTGPGRLAGRYLRLYWQPVYIGRDLPSGRAVPIRIMSDDFTLYRGEGGVPHVVAFRCAHRGTQLSVGSVEGDCIRCFYHGWKYDASGQCVEQPAEDASFAAKVKIRSYPAKEYLGMIFAHLGEGAAPPLPRYPHLEKEGVLTVSTLVRPFNYFNSLENTVDLVHVAFVHRQTVLVDNGIADLLKVTAKESEWGLTLRAPGSNGATKMDQFGMPNILNFMRQPDGPEGLWTDSTVYFVPRDDESYHAFTFMLGNVTGEAAKRYKERSTVGTGSASDVTKFGQAILRGEARVSDFQHHPGVVAIQDFVTQAGQGVIADRKHERLGRSDEGVILLRKIWQRELKALAEGRSLKQWARTLEMRVTSGAPEDDRIGVSVS